MLDSLPQRSVMVRLRNSDLRQKPKPHTSAAVYSRAFGRRPDVTLNLVEEMHCYKADRVFFRSPSSPCPLTLCRKSHSSLVSPLQNFKLPLRAPPAPSLGTLEVRRSARFTLLSLFCYLRLFFAATALTSRPKQLAAPTTGEQEGHLAVQ